MFQPIQLCLPESLPALPTPVVPGSHPPTPHHRKREFLSGFLPCLQRALFKAPVERFIIGLCEQRDQLVNVCQQITQAGKMPGDNDVERPKISVKAGVSELKFSQEPRASECLFLIILFTSWGK